MRNCNFAGNMVQASSYQMLKVVCYTRTSIRSTLGKNGLPGDLGAGDVEMPGSENALFKHGQGIVQNSVLGCQPLDFSTGGLGQRSGFDQHHDECLEFMHLSNRFANGFDHTLEFAPIFSTDLTEDHHDFLIAMFNGKSCTAMAPQGQVTLFHGLFNILRVMVPAANDDAIFQSSSNEQLMIEKKTEITSAQVRAFAALQYSPKSFFCFRRIFPIS